MLILRLTAPAKRPQKCQKSTRLAQTPKPESSTSINAGSATIACEHTDHMGPINVKNKCHDRTRSTPRCATHRNTKTVRLCLRGIAPRMRARIQARGSRACTDLPRGAYARRSDGTQESAWFKCGLADKLRRLHSCHTARSSARVLVLMVTRPVNAWQSLRRRKRCTCSPNLTFGIAKSNFRSEMRAAKSREKAVRIGRCRALAAEHCYVYREG
jgi:hypothetical protein